MTGRERRDRSGRLLGFVVLVFSVAVASAGCAKLRAAVQPEIPLLDAPAPPPRVITPVQAEATAPPETAADEQVPPEREPPRPEPVRTEPAKPTPVRTEPAKPTSPARSELERETAKPEEPRPSRSLQTPDSGSVSERAIREQLAHASAELQRVDYRSLSPNLKEQYDVAKRFMQQSEEALKAGNLVYASTLAGKAAEIGELLPR